MIEQGYRLVLEGLPYLVLTLWAALMWHCPIFKPYFGWRLPRQGEWFK
jgi:hypothetical protein